MSNENKKYPVTTNARENRSLDRYTPYEYVTYDSPQPEEDINIQDYIDVLIRRKWLILFALIVSVVVALIATLSTVPLYEASATIEIKPDIPKITSFEDILDAEKSTSYDYFDTQFKLIKSKSLAEIVVADLKSKSELNSSKNKDKQDSYFELLKDTIYSLISKQKPARENTTGSKNTRIAPQKVTEPEINAFISGLIVGPVDNTRLARISYVSSDPGFASMAANSVVDNYIEWILERRVGTSKSARKFLETQLEEIKVKIEKAEENLATFAKNVDIVSLDKDIDLNYKQLVEITDSLSKLETEIIKKQTLYQEVKSGNYTYLPDVVSNPRIQELSSEYSELKSKYDNKAAVYGPNYPEIKQLSSQLAGIKSELQSTLSGIAESIKKDYEAAIDQEKLLKEKAEEKKTRSAELNEQAIQYRILEREVETNKSIYDDLLQRLKETEVTSAIKETNVQVVDYASVPKFPFKPDMKKNLLYSIMIGLMMGCFISFGLEFFNTKLRDEEEIKKKFSYVPYLGAIPYADESDMGQLEKIVHANPRSVVAEAFRVIRTSILYSSPDHPPKTILVTSSQPIEGKTTSSSNLALSMIQSNLKTILIDGDLRKPRLHKMFAVNGNSVGLSTYLVGKEVLDNIISQSNIDGLDIIQSGPIPPNPAELLGSKRMRELLEILSERYEHIIIDGAPITGFADSRLLSRLVDGVLLVTSVGITQKTVLKNSLEEIRKVGGKILGTIVNRLDTSRDKYKYNYYYYYTDEKRIENKEKRSISSHSN